ncbi:hypothetical protein PV326_008114 [Microctonus aethiopoides]|nr:hypothetical protein PV326_008114 [Microctonus aethiopoides]
MVLLLALGYGDEDDDDDDDDDGGGLSKLPTKKPLHADHADDKWDSSDMDDENDSIETKGENPTTLQSGRRYFPIKPEQSPKLAKIMNHIKLIWLEFMKMLEGTHWYDFTKTVLLIIDKTMECLNINDGN